MTETSFPATAVAGSRAVSGDRRRRPWEFLLEALHHSRRLQANRILNQYADLIAKSDQPAASDRGGLEGH